MRRFPVPHVACACRSGTFGGSELAVSVARLIAECWPILGMGHPASRKRKLAETSSSEDRPFEEAYPPTPVGGSHAAGFQPALGRPRPEGAEVVSQGRQPLGRNAKGALSPGRATETTRGHAEVE